MVMFGAVPCWEKCWDW